MFYIKPFCQHRPAEEYDTSSVLDLGVISVVVLAVSSEIKVSIALAGCG